VLILIYLLHHLLQPGADVCSTSGTSSREENHFDEAGIDEILFKPPALSNKERLILRKQALKMRKRPVLAVGTTCFCIHIPSP
jgi:hypothetical protein